MKMFASHITLCALVAIFAGCGSGTGVLLTVTNPAPFERPGETVEVPLDELAGSFKVIASGRIAVVEARSGKELLSQVTDDALLFQSDFMANEKKEFSLKQIQASPEPHQPLVDARFVLPREDYAWENDRVAFRMYGPALAKDVNNGIDVWTKRVRHLIVAKWYKESEGSLPGKDTYHEDRGEGADFFSVGRTLGGGSSGLWLRNTLYQPGVFSSYKTISAGPLRASFELTYDNWNIAGTSFIERKRITLDAGSNLNHIEVSFEGIPGGDSLFVAAGLVKRANTSPTFNKGNGWLSLWGLTTSDPVNGSLGTGIVIDPLSFAGFAEDSSHHLALGRISSDGKVAYYSGAGWTRSGDFPDEQSWLRYLDAFAQRLKYPLTVSIHRQ